MELILVHWICVGFCRLDRYAIAKFAESFEMIPTTLAENAGLNAMDLATIEGIDDFTRGADNLKVVSLIIPLLGHMMLMCWPYSSYTT